MRISKLLSKPYYLFWRKRFQMMLALRCWFTRMMTQRLMLRTGDFIVAVNQTRTTRIIDASSRGQVALILGTDFDVQFDGPCFISRQRAIIAMQARASKTAWVFWN